MNAGGFRVSPIELEHCLSQVQGITSLACVEVEIKTDAKIIVAFYSSVSSDIETHLKDHAQMHLADYKRPKLMCVLTPCPKTRTVRLTEMHLDR